MKDDYSNSSSPSAHEENMHDEGRTYKATSVAGLPPLQEHGPVIDHKIPQDDVVQAQPDLAWSKIRHAMREPFSEFLGKHFEPGGTWLGLLLTSRTGTFILIMFGDGVVAQVVLSNGANGDYQSISWGWGLGVMLGVYTSGISGAHLNPGMSPTQEKHTHRTRQTSRHLKLL